MKRETAIFVTIGLLICSCAVMTVAWYLHLTFKDWPIWKAVFISWSIALGEYSLMIPANRLGHSDAQLSAATLRAIAELAIIVAFILFQTLVLREKLKVNHIVGFCLVVVGVVIVVVGPWDTAVYTPTPRADEVQGSGVSETNHVQSLFFLDSAETNFNAHTHDGSSAGDVQLTELAAAVPSAKQLH
jgi:uncharacterized protein (DUF486 family)